MYEDIIYNVNTTNMEIQHLKLPSVVPVELEASDAETTGLT